MRNMDYVRLQQSGFRSLRSLVHFLPVLIAVILLLGMLQSVMDENLYRQFFVFSGSLQTVSGALFGSLLAGNPITSYVIGNELLLSGITLAGVTAFLVSWVTVGVVQLPAEGQSLGLRFALIRATVSFIFAIVIGAIVSVGVGLV